MQKIWLSLLGVLTLAGSALAAYPVPSDVRYLLNRGMEPMRKTQLGVQIIDKKVQLMKAQYDYSVSGGAVSTISLLDVDGKAAKIPSKAVIKQVLFDVVTAPTSNGAATLTFTLQSAGDLKASTAYSSFTGEVAGVPVGTAATMFKTTAERTPSVVIGSSALTAGKINAFIEYYLSD